jgi:hypothetical protein
MNLQMPAKPKHRPAVRHPIPSAGSVPIGSFLGNDSPHNFANRAHEFFAAAEALRKVNNDRPNDPAYLLAFLALELYLKAFLLGVGDTLRFVEKSLGHSIERALERSEAKGLPLHLDAQFRKDLIQASKAYELRDFQYRGNRRGPVLLPRDLLDLVEHVRRAAKFLPAP